MKAKWRKICKNLQKTVESGTYKVWIEPLEAVFEGQTLKLMAPNPYVADWVRTRLSGIIAQVAAQVLGSDVELLIEATSADARPKRPLRATVQRNMESSASGALCLQPEQPATVARQLYLPIAPVPRAKVNWQYDFDSFVVGPCNDLAFAAAQDLARCKASVGTLFLNSGPGLGKTHLAQAVGQALCTKSNRSALQVDYLSAESFASGFVQAMRSKDIDGFKGRFRQLDVLLLEDVHFLQGKEKMQVEVLSTLRTIQERGGRVILTSSFAPRELSQVDEGLVSRFCSGFLAHIEKPDFSTRRKMLNDKASLQNVSLGGEVCDLLAERLSGDVRQLESCLHNVLLRARCLNRPLDIELALDVLSQYGHQVPFIDLEAIIRRVCEGFGLSPESLSSRSRKATLVNARNTIFYLARKHTDLSLKGIGEQFNRRHSTVLKGIASVERELSRESTLGRQMSATLAAIERRQM